MLETLPMARALQHRTHPKGCTCYRQCCRQPTPPALPACPQLASTATALHCNGAAALIAQVTAVPHQTCRNESLPKKIRTDIAELWKNTRLLSQQFYTPIQDMKNPHDCVYFHRNYDTEWVSTFTYSPEFNATVLTILSNLLSQR